MNPPHLKAEDLGYSPEMEKYRQEQNLSDFGIARVMAEHRERYLVWTEKGDFEAELIGNLRYSARDRSDFPAVGDWVAVSEYDSHKALIHAVFPRKNSLERQAVGKTGEKQLIASNVDYAFIVQAVDRDFNINRMERYLAICLQSKIQALIILSKTDLIDSEKLEELKTKVHSRLKDIPVFAISNQTGVGVEEVLQQIQKAKTYCLLGSSGVGKSSLSNLLTGKDSMKTGNISDSTQKGRHVTSHREMMLIKNGGILIDNPGMREVGISDAGEGLEQSFSDIYAAAEKCRYSDCTHTSEAGCEVIRLVKSGDIDASSWENFLKMQREKSYFEMSVTEKRKKDKDFGKMIKNTKNDIQKIKPGRFKK